jgi:hypothetical protein
MIARTSSMPAISAPSGVLSSTLNVRGDIVLPSHG